MRIGRTYRHPNCTEVDLHVVELVRVNEDIRTLLVAWINRHYPHIMYEDEVTVKYVDEVNWRKV